MTRFLAAVLASLFLFGLWLWLWKEYTGTWRRSK